MSTTPSSAKFLFSRYGGQYYLHSRASSDVREAGSALIGFSCSKGCERQMIFDMLKSLRSVVYLPGDYVCRKVHAPSNLRSAHLPGFHHVRARLSPSG